ncbi:MAG: hypothetical protein ACSHX7_10815 [Luteolibacter sp.]
MNFPLKTLAAAALITITLPSCGTSSFSSTPTLPPAKTSPAIFKNYRPDGNSSMAGGWASGMDMSGVSFNDKRTATLITPRHVVMAKHYTRPAGKPVVFHDRSGKHIERKLIGFQNLSQDITVGLLNEPVPSNYTPYPLPSTSSDFSQLAGKPVIVTDQNKNLFVHLVSSIYGGQISFKQDERDIYGWGKSLVTGDSGNPSFLIVGNKLVLIETHTSGGAGSGPFYGDPAVQAQLRAAVAKLDPSYKISTIKVP